MKIPIKHAIESGAWFKHYGYGWNISSFRFKLLSFKRSQETLSHGTPWVLKLEVVNLLKESVADSHIAHNILIEDENDYRFSGTSYKFHSCNLNPKINCKGEIIYLLPDQEDSDLFISPHDGDIQEV